MIPTDASRTGHARGNHTTASLTSLIGVPAPARRAAVLRAATTVALCALLTTLTGTVPGLTSARAAPSPRSCRNATLPPPPVDSSEVPPPGVPSPEPLPVPTKPVGGPKMGSCGVVVAEGAPPPPRKVHAATWVLAELGSGDVLAAKNPHGRHRPASTIKVLTALVAIRELEMTDTITARRSDAAMEGSKVGLVPGVTYTVRQVLTGLIMQSGNDAAHALARELGGRAATLRKMNRLAHELGALDTRAATPSGLDGPGMSTSAYDLALIFRAAMRQPVFAEIAATKFAKLPGRPGQPPMTISSDNDVLMRYPGAIGGKTGYTDDARHTYIAAAERDGRRLVVVLMRGENQPVTMDQQVTALLDYGFLLPDKIDSVGTLNQPEPDDPTEAAPQEVAGSSEKAATESGTSLFGTVGGPLALLAVASIAVLGVLGVRRRRVKLAASARNEQNRSDEHP